MWQHLQTLWEGDRQRYGQRKTKSFTYPYIREEKKQQKMCWCLRELLQLSRILYVYSTILSSSTSLCLFYLFRTYLLLSRIFWHSLWRSTASHRDGLHPLQSITSTYFIMCVQKNSRYLPITIYWELAACWNRFRLSLAWQHEKRVADINVSVRYTSTHHVRNPSLTPRKCQLSKDLFNANSLII